MRPRRPLRSPIRSPAKSDGAYTSTFMIGSRIVGRARVIASLKASRPAILNESSFESTSWYEPSNTVTRKSTIGIAGEIAAHACFLDALFDGRNELPRNRAAENVVDELEVGAARQRLDLDLAVAELPVAAGLLLVPAVRLGRGLDRLAVRNARRLQVDVDAESPLQLRDRHFDVQLPLAREQQLLRLRIAAVADRRILFLEAVHRRADLVFVAAALRLDGVRQHRLRKFQRGKHGRIRFVAERVVGERVLQLRHGAEVAGAQLRHVRLRLALEQHDVAEPLGRVARLVVHGRVGLQHARHDAEHRDAAGKRIGNRLPDERRRRRRSRRTGARSLRPSSG